LSPSAAVGFAAQNAIAAAADETAAVQHHVTRHYILLLSVIELAVSWQATAAEDWHSAAQAARWRQTHRRRRPV